MEQVADHVALAPSVEEWFTAADALAALMRRKLSGENVTRGEARKVVEEYERVRHIGTVKALAALR
jgi:hypothetical protein